MTDDDIRLENIIRHFRSSKLPLLVLTKYGDVVVEGKTSVQDVPLPVDDCVVSARHQLRLFAGCRGRHGEVC